MDAGTNGETPVRSKAVLVDPASMTLVWANEAALVIMTGSPSTHPGDVPFEQVALMLGVPGLRDEVARVAQTGESVNLQARLVGTGRGSLELSSSLYRLPGGTVLLLTENAWQSRPASAPGRPRRSRG